jgi:hypothetical protein
MGSLKVADTAALSATPAAPARGRVEITCGTVAWPELEPAAADDAPPVEEDAAAELACPVLDPAASEEPADAEDVAVPDEAPVRELEGAARDVPAPWEDPPLEPLPPEEDEPGAMPESGSSLLSPWVHPTANSKVRHMIPANLVRLICYSHWFPGIAPGTQVLPGSWLRKVWAGAINEY